MREHEVWLLDACELLAGLGVAAAAVLAVVVELVVEAGVEDACELLAGLGVAAAAVLAVVVELVVGAGVEVVVGSQHSTAGTEGAQAST